jgi:hypothetical protein
MRKSLFEIYRQFGKVLSKVFAKASLGLSSRERGEWGGRGRTMEDGRI